VSRWASVSLCVVCGLGGGQYPLRVGGERRRQAHYCVPVAGPARGELRYVARAAQGAHRQPVFVAPPLADRQSRRELAVPDVVGVAVADHLLAGHCPGPELHPVGALIPEPRSEVVVRLGITGIVGRRGRLRRAEVRAGGGAAAVAVGVGVDVVGALLVEMTAVLDCGCCHGLQSIPPITPSSSNTAATEMPISHRVTELAVSP
jgi:hypothetical protein